MGFQLGPKFLRSAPRGWLPARAYPLRHQAYTHPQSGGPEGGGESVFETSAGLTVTWRVEIEGRPPYEVEERRSGPTWLLGSALAGGGKRWYKPRVRPNSGLVRELGVPCVIDPDNPNKVWVDWDAAYEEHKPAWEQEARVKVAVAKTENAWDYTWERVANPFAGKLRDGEEQLVEEEVARRKAQEEKHLARSQELYEATQAAKGILPVTTEEGAEQRRRADELVRIHQTGRKLKAKVVGREETGRTLANMPVTLITFELQDDGGPRQVVFEHFSGAWHSRRYKPGKRVDVWVDPLDPDQICPGR